MRRRRFLKVVVGGSVIGVVGCAADEHGLPTRQGERESGEATPTPTEEPSPSPSPTPEEDPIEYVEMYDTYAQALYYDGTNGPLTGIVLVQYILVGEPVTLPFWHGHGGQQHQWILTPEHYAQLKAGHRIDVETTVVQGHTHTLFVDPLDPDYRVPGAEPVLVPLS